MPSFFFPSRRTESRVRWAQSQGAINPVNRACRATMIRRSRKEIVMRAMSIVALACAVFLVTPVIADAQTKVLPAAAISAAQIQALMGPRTPNTLPNIRVVDAGGHNVGVGVLYRAEGQTQNTAVHLKVSEVYHVMKGSGTLVTGGTKLSIHRPGQRIASRSHAKMVRA